MAHGTQPRDVERRSPEATHPTLYASMGERVDYACVTGAYMAADEPLSPDDERHVRDLCREIGLPPATVDRVIEAVGEPPEKLRERLFRLRESTLRLMLVRDMVKLGFSDGRYDVRERQRVRGFSALMLVGEDKIKRIEDEVVAELDLAPDVTEEEPEPEGAWAGFVRLTRRLFGGSAD